MKVRAFIALILLTGISLAGAQEASAQTASARKVTSQVAPIYPELAKRLRIQGAVRLEVIIRPNGSVKTAKALGGSPLLVEAAVNAINKWRFEPAPTETTEIVQLTFRAE